VSPQTKARLLGCLKALPTAFWVILASLFALLMGILRYGRDKAQEGASHEATRAEIETLRKAAAGKNDAEAQRLWQEQVRKGRRGKGVLILPLLLLAGQARAADACAETRPSFCPAGWVCVRTDCAVEDAIQKAELRQEVSDLKRKARRVHFDFTCGLGAATVVTQEWDLKAYPTPGACVYGLAIRIGG
jgi:hypothetical protein